MSTMESIVFGNDDDRKKKRAQYLVWLEALNAMEKGYRMIMPLTRNPCYNNQRLLWSIYVKRYQNNDKFIRRHLRMSLTSFYKLLSYIKKGLVVNEYQADKRGGAITPEICLFSTIRWLAGGSYLDIFAITGVSVASFYRIVYKTLELLNTCEELSITFPTSKEACESIAAGFTNISYKEAIDNCVGCLDGYLLRIYTPTKKEAGNVRSYFSGHYQCHGVNIQAICDAHCRFLFFAVASPGSVNDRDAVKETNLLDLLSNVPEGYVVLGDAAYEASEKVVPMYYGVNKLKADCDNFNFYASQLRIRIEMSFGLMQMKWGILWSPLRVKLKHIKYVMCGIARLHNYLINERLLNDDFNDDHHVGSGDDRNYLPSQRENENGIPIGMDCDGNCKPVGYVGISHIRDWMTDKIKAKNLKRPSNNKIVKETIFD